MTSPAAEPDQPEAGQLPQQDAAGMEELISRLDGRARAARAAFLDEPRNPASD